LLVVSICALLMPVAKTNRISPAQSRIKMSALAVHFAAFSGE